MASVTESQLGQAGESFDCEVGSPSGHRQPATIKSNQQTKSAMNITIAFVFGFLIGAMDFGMILEGLGLEPATKQHGAILPNVISFDLDCISAHRKAKHGSFEECELTDHGDKTNSSQAHSQTEKAWVLQSMSHLAFMPATGASHPASAAFSSGTKPRGVAMPSMGTAAVNPEAGGEGGMMAMPPGELITIVDDAKNGENAVKTRKKSSKAALAGAVAAAALVTPAARMAVPAQTGWNTYAKGLWWPRNLADFSAEGINIFDNIRTPAALVAAACLDLAFALEVDETKDTRRMRVMKRMNVFLGYASIASEIIAVIFATNAINRLTEHAGTSETMATSLVELLTGSLFVQFWLGVYIHYITGIIGMLGMVAFRAWSLMGEKYTWHVSSVTIAIGLRLLSGINRGVVVTEFGGGPGGSNFLYLVLHYLKVTFASAWKHRRIADLTSIVFATAGTFLFGRSMVRFFRRSSVNVDRSSEDE
jgi:hypothetical protein